MDVFHDGAGLVFAGAKLHADDLDLKIVLLVVAAEDQCTLARTEVDLFRRQQQRRGFRGLHAKHRVRRH
jgi:hypothetical protein